MLRIRVPASSVIAPVVALAGMLLLAGCDSGTDIRETLGIGTFTSTPEEEARMAAEVAAAQAQASAPRCPQVSVRDGTETYRVFSQGRDGDPAYLVYQGTISRTARECAIQGNVVSMKLGIAGRVILGPQGRAGTFTLPIRVAAVQAGGEAVWSELYRVSVTIPEGQNIADFAHVAEGVTYQVPEGTSSTQFIVYSGFDEQARR